MDAKMSDGQLSYKNLEKTVTIIGLGVIGLPIAVLSALRGYRVFGVDNNPSRIEKIKNLDETSLEPTVAFFLQDEQVMKNLFFSEKISEKTDFFLISVQTYLDENQKIETSHVEQVFSDLIPFLKIGSTIILESTIPVGFSRKMALFLKEKTGLTPGKDFFLAYSPERILPGQAFKELVFNDRILGGVSENSAERASEFFLPIIKGNVFFTNSETAELCKIIENSYRSVQIALANEIDEVCQALEIETNSLLELANKHPRVNFISPGIGVGGECVPVHPYFLKEIIGHVPELINTSLILNKNRTKKILTSIESDINNFIKQVSSANKKPTVLLLGLTYKANTSDLRNSPALEIATALLQIKEISLLVHDPHVDSNIIANLGFEKINSFSEYKKADIIIFLVAHDKFSAFKEIDLSEKFCIDYINFLKKNNTTSPKNKFAHK